MLVWAMMGTCGYALHTGGPSIHHDSAPATAYAPERGPTRSLASLGRTQTGPPLDTGAGEAANSPVYNETQSGIIAPRLAIVQIRWSHR